jgi:Zn-dependent protease
MLGLDVPTIISRMIVLLLAFTIHELAHAITADYLGDPTPRRMGRITLNPIAHLDPIGTLLLLVSGFGWAKPVMVQPFNMKGNPRTSMALVAVAGPLSNVLMAIIFVIPVRLGLIGIQTQSSAGILPNVEFLIFQLIWINIILALFNLLPIAPLDGSKILMGILPANLGAQLRWLDQYGFIILMILVFLVPSALNFLVFTPAASILNIMIGS